MVKKFHDGYGSNVCLLDFDGDDDDKLILPFLELDIKYFDLGLPHRDATNDKVTVESAEATLKYNVAIKCATITPDEARVKEFNLRHMWKSPNGTIRNILNVPTRAEESTELEVFNFTGSGGVALSMYNTDESIRAFAEASMNTAYQKRFMEIFQEVYEREWRSKFEAAGIWAKLDNNSRLLDFTEKLEAACIASVESGKMTKDLALLVHGPKVNRDQYLNTEEFIDAVAEELRAEFNNVTTNLQLSSSPFLETRNNFAPTNLFHKRNPIAPPFSFRCVSELACQSVSMNDIVGVYHNKVLVAAAVSAAIGQLTKPFTSTLLYGKKFDLRAAVQAGGFPSTHSSAAVAAATSLVLRGLHKILPLDFKGFSDAIFGLAVVYASLIMYDAQDLEMKYWEQFSAQLGVRREVGTHARELNKVLLRTTSHSASSRNDAKDLTNYFPRESSPKMENVDPLSSDAMKPTKSSLLLKTDNRKQSNTSFIRSSNVVSEVNGGLESSGESCPQLKESIGHTEVEVAAGALLGFLVSVAICPYV
ncbi:Isocitrate dehydrogenase [NADP] [Sesamum angolense]|uniref:Isocitrate dehydrogenase [NADP] n=1 Tax=Sesamum angolense TaxID=2727404 RepID=A0AAE1W4V9_9LAMI|nr:Isocitrate dehydrogenase [NADP] [Sesamum angolense]